MSHYQHTCPYRLGRRYVGTYYTIRQSHGIENIFIKTDNERSKECMQKNRDEDIDMDRAFDESNNQWPSTYTISQKPSQLEIG